MSSEAGDSIPKSLEGLKTWADEQAKSYVGDEAKRTPEYFYGEELTYCERCGKLDTSVRIKPLGARECDCQRKIDSAAAAIRSVDLSGEMTFENITDADPSVAAAAKASGR